VLKSRKDNGGKIKEKEKVELSKSRTSGIALCHGNRLAAACKIVKVEEAWRRKTDSRGL
jgi:hypothetical protein